MKLSHLFAFLFALCYLPAGAQEDSQQEFEDKVQFMVDSIMQDKTTERIQWDFAAMDVGFSSYLAEGSGFNMPTMYKYLDQNFWRSGHFSLHAVDVKLGLMGKGKVQKLRLGTGVRWNVSYYGFDRQFALQADQNTFQEAVIEELNEIRKHRLTAHYAQIPILLEFKHNPKDDMKSFYLGVGYVHNFLFASRYKLKYKDRDIDKLKVKDDFNLNPSLGMMELRIGYGPVNFYVQYGIDALFATDKGPAVTPINIGFITN